MDALIVTFLSLHHPHEYQREVYRSFQLLEGFEYPNIYSTYIDLLTLESYKSSDQLIDEFDRALHVQLDRVLHEHFIFLTTEATFIQKNEILQALLTLQSLDDYSPVMTILESMESDDEIIAAIIEEYSAIDSSEFLSILDEFNSCTLMKLKEYIEQKSVVQQEQVSYQDLLPRLKQFMKLHGKESVGYGLLSHDVKPGHAFNVYLELLGDQLEPTAINIASLILLDPVSLQSPIAIFNQYSQQLFPDMRHIPIIEAELLRLFNTLDEHVRASQQKAPI